MNPGVQYMCLEGARFIADAAGHLHAERPSVERASITAHGILMMFFVVIPALFGGFGNYFMPLQIGAPDMAFPRMNNLSYWLYVAGTSLAVASVFAPGGDGRARARAWAGCSIRRCPPREGGYVDGPRDLRGPPVGCLVDPWRDQHDHHLPEHARAGHDHAQGAAVRLVDLRHRLADPAGAAGSGRCDHHAADRPQLRHHLLRRPQAAATRSSTSTSCGSSATRKSTSSSCPAFGIISHVIATFSQEADLRLPADGLCDGRHRRAGLRRLGAPHVHGRHVADPAKLLHAGHDGHRGAHRHQDLLVDRHDVGRLDRVQDADALGLRLPVPVHRGRRDRHRAQPGRRRPRLSRHLLRRGALPLRDVARRRVRHLRRASTSGSARCRAANTRNGPASCTSGRCSSART